MESPPVRQSMDEDNLRECRCFRKGKSRCFLATQRLASVARIWKRSAHARLSRSGGVLQQDIVASHCSPTVRHVRHPMRKLWFDRGKCVLPAMAAEVTQDNRA
eukprot:scaffold124045_cov30-Tisochrysis_lutea.AAC.3